jgi:hypothetical protein
MSQPSMVRPQTSTIARTIRFPAALRDRIAADAERCGRSFEAHVIALLRRHYGEDVDIAPAPTEILALAAATLAGVPASDRRLLTRKLPSDRGVAPPSARDQKQARLRATGDSIRRRSSPR